MRPVRHTALAGLVAGTAALGLVAAAAPAQEVRVGSARTSMLGASIELTNLPVEVPALSVLDASTFASIDDDTARNPLGSPLAEVIVTPLRVGEDAVGAISASSNGQTSATSGNAVTDALAPLGADVAPITATATAGADEATALVGGAVAEVTAVLGALGVDLDVSGIVSHVDQESANAMQGLEVGAIDIDLADLGLDAELLGTLPLGDLLELLEQLPLELPADVQAVVDAIVAQLEALGVATDAVASLTEGVPADAAQLAAIDAALTDAGPLAGLYASVVALPGANTATTLGNLLGLLGSASAGDVAILQGCADLSAPTVLNVDDIVADLTDCVGGQLLATNDEGETGVTNPTDPAELVDALLGGQADLVASLSDLVGELPGGLGSLADVLDQLTAAIGDLDGLLDVLDGLLDDIADTSILSVSAFEVGVNAIAGATEAASSATLVCSAVDVTILGETLSAPSCKDGLDQIAAALATVDDAVATVIDLLNALPLGELVQVGDLGVEVFGELTESVSTVDGYVTATAGMELLDLRIPSVTIDPSAVTDGLLGDALDGLAVPDVLGSLGLDELGLPLDDAPSGTLAGALATLEGLDPGIGLGDVVTDLSDVVASVADVDGIVAQLDGIVAMLDGLDLGDLGSIAEAVTTPGLNLVVDPTSTAEYAVTAAPAPAPAPVPTTPAPAPVTPTTPPAAPTPAQPAMPATGGGMALLGLLAAGGALALRRRLD